MIDAVSKIEEEKKFSKINACNNQAASSHVKRLVGERGDWEVEVERLRSLFSHMGGGGGFSHTDERRV